MPRVLAAILLPLVLAAGCARGTAVAPAGVPAAAGGPYRLVAVVDGDTVRVDVHGRVERVRLIGIDTPETKDPRRPVQCFGRQASARAHALLDGHRVYLAGDPTQDRRDRYGRLLAYLWRDDGLFYNERVVAEGYAHEYTYAVPYRYRAAFRAAEADARRHDRGLWAPATCAGDTTKGAR